MIVPNPTDCGTAVFTGVWTFFLTLVDFAGAMALRDQPEHGHGDRLKRDGHDPGSWSPAIGEIAFQLQVLKPQEGGMAARRVTVRVGKAASPRSEERRVGKECRSRWSP